MTADVWEHSSELSGWSVGRVSPDPRHCGSWDIEVRWREALPLGRVAGEPVRGELTVTDDGRRIASWTLAPTVAPTAAQGEELGRLYTAGTLRELVDSGVPDAWLLALLDGTR